VARPVGFGQLLIQLAQRRLQALDPQLLIGDLLREVLAQFLVAHGPLQRGAREIVLLLVHGQLGATQPVGMRVELVRCGRVPRSICER
jgi:hypothetical protein